MSGSTVMTDPLAAGAAGSPGITGRGVRELERAFRAFTQTSMQLEAAYRELEERVTVLSAELARAQDARLAELAEKEKLAERLQGLLETLPAGVVVLDERGIVRESNPAAAALLGSAPRERRWADITEESFATDGDGTGELELRDGRRISLVSRELASQRGRILVLIDVTETQRLQTLLARSERLSEMGEMNARLAHQLRTPLAAAILYASQLGRKTAEPDSRRYAGRILESLNHLERMLSDMLCFASGGHPTGMETLTLDDLLADVAHRIGHQLPAGALHVESAPGLELQGNREALAGALVNLLSNAHEHGGDGVHIEVEARAGTDGALTVVVADDGPGIPPAIRTRIFEPFFTTRPNGIGLGLAVVGSVVRAHGGEIEVGEAPGGGARFVLTLPHAQGERLLPSEAALTAEAS